MNMWEQARNIEDVLDEREPPMRLVFACGASYEGVEEMPKFEHRRKDGAGRLAVYDSDGGIQRPQLAGDDAPCMLGCPAKRKSGRKYFRCFPSDEQKFKGQRDAGGRMGVEIPWRHVVTCYCEVQK